MRLVIIPQLAFVAAICFGCTQGIVRPPPRAADANTMRVDGIVENPSRDWFQRSGWYRPAQDLTTPARVYVSGAWACVLETPELVEPLIGRFYTCMAGWRSPKGT